MFDETVHYLRKDQSVVFAGGAENQSPQIFNFAETVLIFISSQWLTKHILDLFFSFSLHCGEI